ncbi:putative membrane protein [Streptomyces glaucescens]|uniref:Putative membrane protein n=2 Tax=Streptomyces glaucescens TaxID=1907 RepID=A0A089WXA2_STRGA|nr:putative membrane protein [Streptomyces glaucescens]
MDEHELKRAADVGLAQREADKRTVERMRTIALRLSCAGFFFGLCGWLLDKL